MKKRLLPLCLACFLLFAATSCGGEDVAPSVEPERPSVAPAPSPTATPYAGPVNPLTGLPMGEEAVGRRPIAVMLNNLPKALPQLGQSQADIIYECLAEGGITRMLGVYQSVADVGAIGSVRSSRPYYLELALGHDAVYLHAGGSEDAYAKIKEWGVTALDCVRGPYEGKTPGANLFWRDADRRKNNGLEHSVVTNGETITKMLPTLNLRLEHEEGYAYGQTFLADGTPAGGSPAPTIRVPFSSFKTGVFTYSPEAKGYLVEEYDAPYVDGNSGEQVVVTNVLALKTACKQTGDSLGHVTVDLTGEGDGYFACGGSIIPIRWSKADRNSSFTYTTGDGSPLVLGQGRSYVSIVPLESSITY